jgi:hypothetical protein
LPVSFVEKALAAWVGDDTGRVALVRELADREVPVSGREPTELTSDVVIDVFGPVTCDKLLREWAGSRRKRRKVAAQNLTEALHGLEMERAAQPPQVTLAVPVTVGGGSPEEPAGDGSLVETTYQLRERLQRM